MSISDYEKANLARQLENEFKKTATIPEDETKVQRYSESTKTLYSDEELAKKMIHRYVPEQKKEEKPEMTTDEMLKLLRDEHRRQNDEPVVRRGYAKIEVNEGKWHS